MSSLSDLQVLLIDCQATGASPTHGHLLELGWAATSAAEIAKATEIPVSSHLIRLPPGATLPWRVAELTGLGPDDLASAVSDEQVWQELLSVTSGLGAAGEPTPAVIHCARFEESFLAPLHARVAGASPFPLRLICTLEIARRVLPDIPRRGLRALAGYFGHGTEDLRRSAGHVRATAVVWRHLVSTLAKRGVRDQAALDDFLAASVPRSGRRVYPMPKTARLALPDAPGVYRLLRSGGDVLYVGKATSIRRRVNSYFQKQSALSERMLELLSQARDVEVTRTATAFEAALLETDEIKQYAPPYNVALKAHGRSPWFAQRGLLDLAPDPSARHRVGPLGSPWWIRRLWGLWSAVTEQASKDTVHRGLVQALGRAAGEAPADILFGGLALFCARMPLRTHDPGQLLNLGTAAWRQRQEVEPEIADEMSDDDADQDWDEDAVCEGLEDIVVSVAHALRRAHWLRRLSESWVAWRHDGVWRVLRVERARVIDRFETTGMTPRPGPGPSGARRSLRARRWSFDLASFDRMRVLTTELRRVLGEGGRAEVRFGPHEVLRSDRLRRTLEWV